MKTRNYLKICNFRKEIGIKGEKTIKQVRNQIALKDIS